MDLIVICSPTLSPVFLFFKVSLGCVTPFALVNESARYALIFIVSVYNCATLFLCLIFAMHPCLKFFSLGFEFLSVFFFSFFISFKMMQILC